MPICPFSCLSALILCAIPAAVAVVGAGPIAGGPASEDIYAVIGAMLASVVVLVDYGGTPGGRRGTMQFTTVFISSAFIGSIGPGVAANTVIPESVGVLSWHSWAMLGFVFGLAGWVLTRSVLWVFNRRIPGAIDDYVQSKLPPKPKDD
jgi:hypothetical protein